MGRTSMIRSGHVAHSVFSTPITWRCDAAGGAARHSLWRASRRAAAPLLSMAAALLLCAPSPGAQGPRERARAFERATLLPISAPPIENGVLVVTGGRIAALGAEGQVEIPADAERIDCRGLVLMPGLVDTHSHVGSPWGADSSSPLQPEVRALDSIDVAEASLMRARAGGLTSLNAMPGSGHLIGGQTVYLKLRRARSVEELCYRFEDGGVMGGLKMANGTNPQGAPPFPETRAKAAALVRAKFLEAQAYAERRARAAADPKGEPVARDLGLEALVEVLEGKRIVHHHTHRADDILSVLRLSREFGFRTVLHHVSEAWKVPDEILASGAACSVILVDAPGGKLEARDLSLDTPRVLHEAGVPLSLHSDDFITDSRLFLRAAALAVRAELPREAALEALTLGGARQMDLQARIGSLEVGKDADLVLLDGDPLSIYTRVLETWVEGQRVFDLDAPADALYAEGGPGAGDPLPPISCCGPFLRSQGGAR
jgi:imidazolonepropionase-like amidohydrolase